jgi:Zn-finger nucleic acid-binding protein
MILIACPTCDRQYDVSHVAAGGRVRCLCDAVITVGTQGSLRVRALHCSHCGGAVEADEPSCRWCSAKLTAKDRLASTLCPRCFARIEDDSRHCKACGVAIAPQALTPLPEGGACPRCKGALLIRALGAADVVECGDCGGVWLTAKTFEAVCRDAERKLDAFRLASADGLTNAAPEPPGRKYIPCLACGELMLRRSFRYGARPSGVVVDACRGHGVWLDQDELERVVQHVRRHARGAGEGGPADAELAAYLERPPGAARAAASRSPGPATSGWLLEGLSELVLALGGSFFD